MDTDSSKLGSLISDVFNLSTPGMEPHFWRLKLDFISGRSTYTKQRVHLFTGVIISVKGSLLGFSVTSKVEQVIKRGLLKAAMTTNGWITTPGINAG